MKITCRCGKVLTETLRPLKKMGVRPYLYSDPEDNDVEETETFYPRGTFELQRKRKYGWGFEDSGIKGYYKVIHEPEVLVVPQESVLEGVIPHMPQGYGCCNWSMGQELKCECGRVIAEMYLDCYEMQTVNFLSKQIVRSYKD